MPSKIIRYRLSKEIMLKETPGGVVIYTKSRNIYAINRTGLFFLKLATTKMPDISNNKVDEITRKKYETDKNVGLQEDFDEFIKNLLDAEILVQEHT